MQDGCHESPVSGLPPVSSKPLTIHQLIASIADAPAAARDAIMRAHLDASSHHLNVADNQNGTVEEAGEHRIESFLPES